MVTDKFEEFEQVKIKFNALIKEGKDFGDNLTRGIKKKTVFSHLKTPFESNDIEAKEQNRDATLLKDSMKYFFLNKIFTHYNVNPSRGEYTKQIVDTYVNKNLKKDNYLKKDIARVANEDDSLYEYVKSILKRENTEEIHQEDRIRYLVGIRGAGKTSYINYFISKYETDLNAENIISIRINVMRIYDDNSLEDAIKFKVCRILFTYYCTFEQEGDERLKNNCHIKKNINPYLTKIIEDGDYCEDNINKCSDYFKAYKAKEPRKIPPEYKDLCTLLLKRVVKDYKFVIMLDNFDMLTPMPKYEEIFDKRKNELRQINSSFFFNYSVFIIAIRYNTYNELIDISRRKKECYLIGTPTTFDMLNKRIDFFSQQDADKRKINCLKNLIILIGNSFISETKTVNTINFEQACNLLDDIFYGNKRLIINMIDRFINIIPQNDFDSLCESNFEIHYDNFYDRLIAETHYKFLESLLINIDTGFCNCFFEYKREKEKYSFSQINATAHFDENFLPNIYRFPAISGNDLQFIPFLKIRILQLLKNAENSDEKEDLTMKTIAEKLYIIFGYYKDATILACEELRWDQSILIEAREPDGILIEAIEAKETNVDKKNIDNIIKDLPLIITERGKKLLDILPINANLIAITLEQIFLPVSFLKTKLPIGNYNDRDISNFIIKNIYISLPKTIGLLNAIELHEKNVLNRSTKTNQSYFITSNFEITEKLKFFAEESIRKIYFSYFEPNIEDRKYDNRRTELKEQLGI